MNENYEDIKELKKVEKGHVPWAIFIFTMGTFVAAIGWVFVQVTATQTVANEAKASVADVKGDIKEINANIGWIKSALEKSVTQF